jgi:IS30 family transposase
VSDLHPKVNRQDSKGNSRIPYQFLRRRGKKYNHKSSKTAGRGCIPNRIDIQQRPKIVEKKSRLGDWEGDTLIGAKQQGVILSLVDCKSLTLLPISLEVE